MFQRILVFLTTNISTAIYFCAGLLTSDCFQTGLTWCSEDQLDAISARVHVIIGEQYKKNQRSSVVKKRSLNAEIKSVCQFADSYVRYFDYVTLCDSKENVDFSDASLQKAYCDLLRGISDVFFLIPSNLHIYYHKDIERTLVGRLKQGSSRSEFLTISDCNMILLKVVVLPDDRDSVYWHAAQIIKNHEKDNNLPNFTYLLKRIAEIPKEHRHVILREKSFALGFNCTETWLRIIRQANESEYYLVLMYKFIPFLNEQSFWSIFIDYSYNWLSRYPRPRSAHIMPTEEHLNSAFALLHERITGAFIFPRSQEATDALQWYLSPLFPVSLLYKVRSCRALEPCW